MSGSRITDINAAETSNKEENGARRAGEEERTSCERTNSAGAGATPVRGVDPYTCETSPQTDDKNAKACPAEPEEGEQSESEARGRDTVLRKRANSVGAGATPTRGVESHPRREELSTDHLNAEPFNVDPKKREPRERGEDAGTDGTALQKRAITVGASATPSRGVHAEPILHAGDTADKSNVAAEYENIYDPGAYTANTPEAIFTRATDPFNPKRVERIVESVRIGPDLTDAQRAEVQDLVAEYADVFALAISEVFPVAGAVYAPKILLDKKFSTKIHQRPLTRPQAEYLHEQVEVLERAGVIRPIHPRDVKCVSP
ncbi:hypothetical protein B0H19DRAFT_957527, partial [Mycena capillaripes]